MAQRIRQIFIYLAIIAVILGIIGVLIIERDFSGRAVAGKGSENSDIYSLEGISQHNSEEDCWIYSGNEVYDITLFLQVYEDDILKQSCGGGISLDIFEDDIQKILDTYKIGTLD